MSNDATRIGIHDVNNAEAWPFSDASAITDAWESEHQVNQSPLERDAMTHDQQKHFAASELAGLPGMPTSARRVLERAKRDGWPTRERRARGGGSEYPISCLPAVTQAALAEKVLSAAPPASSSSPTSPVGASFSSDVQRAESLAALFDSKPDSMKLEARKRLAVVREYCELLAHQVAREAALDVVTKKHAVSEATLARWLALVKGRHEHVWLIELCPRYAGRVVEAEIPAEALQALQADYLRPERPSAAACIARLVRVAKAHGWTLPSSRTLQRRLERLPRGIKVMKRDGMKAARALYPAQQRDSALLSALEVINGDGYKHNLWVRFPDGAVERAKTWFFQDVHSRKILAARTDKTEHTNQIRLALKDVCERYGVPGAVLLDNTLAAANKAMSGGIPHRFRFKVRDDEPDGVFKLLGITVHWATPGHGQAKPVERAFGTGGIGEYVDKATDFRGAWTGASPLDKPEYDGRHKPVALAELERVIEREVKAWNEMPGRRTPVHQGRSFDDVFFASYRDDVIRKVPEDMLRLLLLSSEPITAGSRDGAFTLRTGAVRGERLANRYWAPTLIDHAGKKLVARFDPKRLHEGLHVYTLDGRWVCYADCDRPAGFMDADAARERARARGQVLRAIKTEAEARLRMSQLDAARTLELPTDGASPAAPAIPAPKVIQPLFKDPLERPHYAPAPRTEEDQLELAALEAAHLAERLAPAAVNVLELRSDADKHAHWKTLAARRAAGDALTDHDEQFWQHWQTQDFYRIAFEAEAQFEEELAARKTA